MYIDGERVGDERRLMQESNAIDGRIVVLQKDSASGESSGLPGLRQRQRACDGGTVLLVDRMDARWAVDTGVVASLYS